LIDLIAVIIHLCMRMLSRMLMLMC